MSTEKKVKRTPESRYVITRVDRRNINWFAGSIIGGVSFLLFLFLLFSTLSILNTTPSPGAGVITLIIFEYLFIFFLIGLMIWSVYPNYRTRLYTRIVETNDAYRVYPYGYSAISAAFLIIFFIIVGILIWI